MIKILAVVFGILTICGGIYVLITGGQANAGFAVVPMAFCVVFSVWARKSHKGKRT
jgi:ABC-type Mn2+/Zn2+ transport system permease subunit